MNNILNKPIMLLFIILAFPNLGYTQDDLSNDLRFEVKIVYPYIYISTEELFEANTLSDLNWRYKPSWVKEYISVEILTTRKGKAVRATNKNWMLSQAQKDMMKMADAGADISVNVRYMPENTLTQNDVKEVSFIVSVSPDNEAAYVGGKEELKKYLKENAMDKIAIDNFDDKNLVAIQFTISKEGEVIDAQVFDSSFQSYQNEEINELLLSTVRNMPCWKPAEYSNGTKVKQEFVLTVGNMESCLNNLINTRLD